MRWGWGRATPHVYGLAGRCSQVAALERRAASGAGANQEGRDASLTMRLDEFDNAAFDRGRPAWVEAAWLMVQWLLVSSWVPGSWHRGLALRLFGARMGRGVVVKPGLKVKFPWKLMLGDHVWLGEDVWLDNLAEVRIGSHVCISQGAYLCTGSHDWSAERFDLVTRPIEVSDRAWIGARATVGPGVVVEEGAVLALGSVATQRLSAWQVYRGVPATAVRERRIAPPPEIS